jgi:hypothetical protein
MERLLFSSVLPLGTRHDQVLSVSHTGPGYGPKAEARKETRAPPPMRFVCSVPHSGLPAPVRERMREPNHLRNNERAVPRSVRGGAVLSAGATIRAHQRCVSLLARRMPAQGAHLRPCNIRAPVKVSSMIYARQCNTPRLLFTCL